MHRNSGSYHEYLSNRDVVYAEASCSPSILHNLGGSSYLMMAVQDLESGHIYPRSRSGCIRLEEWEVYQLANVMAQ